MNARFPTPLADELWISVVARFLRKHPSTARLQYARTLLGDGRAAVAFDYPRRLGFAASGLAERSGIDARYLLASHTLLPLHRPFVSANRWPVIEAKALGDAHIHFLLGVGPSRITQPRYLRRCPLCAKIDIRRTGQEYWHRVHHLPGMLVCADHGIPLEETVALVHRNAAFELIAAQDAGTRSTIYLSKRERKIMRAIATDLASLLDPRLPSAEPWALGLVYREYLADAGLLTTAGRIAQESLCRALVNHFGGPLLQRIGCDVDTRRRDHWVARLLYDSKGHQSPLRHVLLAHFLKRQIIEALKAAQHCKPAPQLTDCPRARFAKSSCTATQLEEKQNRWLAIRATETGNLRKRHDALYSWLWRNCPAWLAESCHTDVHQLTLPLGYRKQLDRQLAMEIEFAKQSAVEDNPMARLSTRRIAERTSRPNIVRSHPESFPAVCSALARYVETVDVCAIRKVNIAATTLKSRVRFKRWRLVAAARLAGTTAHRPTVTRLIDSLLRA